jgi:hypothetical protein
MIPLHAEAFGVATCLILTLADPHYHGNRDLFSSATVYLAGQDVDRGLTNVMGGILFEQVHFAT